MRKRLLSIVAFFWHTTIFFLFFTVSGLLYMFGSLYWWWHCKVNFLGTWLHQNIILKYRVTLSAVHYLRLLLLNRSHAKSLVLVQYLKIKAKFLKHILLQALKLLVFIKCYFLKNQLITNVNGSGLDAKIIPCFQVHIYRHFVNC